MENQIITDDAGKVYAVLAGCTLALAQEVARQYARILCCATYRHTFHSAIAPKVGDVLPSLNRTQRFTVD